MAEPDAYYGEESVEDSELDLSFLDDEAESSDSEKA